MSYQILYAGRPQSEPSEMVPVILYSAAQRLEEQIAALKAERNGYLNGQQQMQDTCSSLQDSIAKYAGERKVLKAEVKRLRELVDCLEFDIGNKY